MDLGEYFKLVFAGFDINLNVIIDTFNIIAYYARIFKKNLRNKSGFFCQNYTKISTTESGTAIPGTVQ